MYICSYSIWQHQRVFSTVIFYFVSLWRKAFCRFFRRYKTTFITYKTYKKHKFHYTKKMKNYFYLSLLLPLVGLLSCGHTNNNSDNSDSANAHAEVAGANDSAAGAAGDSTKAVKPDTTVAKIKLPTTEAQLAHMRTSGSWDKYQNGILPKMAEDVPEYSEKILQANKRFIIVDKGKMKLFLYDPYGNILKSYGIACARNYGDKQGSWDSRTIEGYFEAEGLYDSKTWRFRNASGRIASGPGVFGPWFLRVKGSIGIHGTSSPSSIGKRCSHGCIRVTNDNIRDLIQYVGKGTPIIVSPGPKDMAVNKSAGIYKPSVVTEIGTARAVPGVENKTATDNTLASKSTKKESSQAVASEKSVKKVQPKADANQATAPAVNEEKATPKANESKESKPSEPKVEPKPEPKPAAEPKPATSTSQEI